MKKILFAIAAIVLLMTSSLWFGLAQDENLCRSGEDDDLREDTFTDRHPDDGSYVGIFSDADTPLDTVSLPLYSSDSPFNQPIPDDAALDEFSDERIDRLVEEAASGTVVSVRTWTVAAYVTDESTPRYDVQITACWSPYRVFHNVPIPDGALPDPVGDGQMAILALDEGYEYDFWQMEQNSDGTWQAAWANRIALDSDGIYPNGMSARGSGFALLNGLVWPVELETSEINHALIVTVPIAADGGPVLPATESDGHNNHRFTLAEGVRLQLDPDLNLDSLGLEPWQRTIAEALQKYGAFVADNGSDVLEFEVMNPISWTNWVYPFGEPDFDYWESGIIELNIPVEHFRVLAFGEQDADFEDNLAEDESLYD